MTTVVNFETETQNLALPIDLYDIVQMVANAVWLDPSRISVYRDYLDFDGANELDYQDNHHDLLSALWSDYRLTEISDKVANLVAGILERDFYTYVVQYITTDTSIMLHEVVFESSHFWFLASVENKKQALQLDQNSLRSYMISACVGKGLVSADGNQLSFNEVVEIYLKEVFKDHRQDFIKAVFEPLCNV